MKDLIKEVVEKEINIVFLERIRTKKHTLELYFKSGNSPDIVIRYGEGVNSSLCIPFNFGLPLKGVPEKIANSSKLAQLDYLINDVSPMSFSLQERGYIWAMNACVNKNILDENLEVVV